MLAAVGPCLLMCWAARLPVCLVGRSGCLGGSAIRMLGGLVVWLSGCLDFS